jgi:hypothetical protein
MIVMSTKAITAAFAATTLAAFVSVSSVQAQSYDGAPPPGVAPQCGYERCDRLQRNYHPRWAYRDRTLRRNYALRRYSRRDF